MRLCTSLSWIRRLRRSVNSAQVRCDSLGPTGFWAESSKGCWGGLAHGPAKQEPFGCKGMLKTKREELGLQGRPETPISLS